MIYSQYLRSLLKITILVLTLFINSLAHSQERSQVKNGTLSAPDWSFLEGKPLQLTGKWEVIWGELVDPVDYDQKYKGEYFQLPNIWNRANRPEMNEAYGTATFRLHLNLPQYNRGLSYHIISPNAAWRFYVDGVYSGGNGVVTDNPKEFQSHYISRFFDGNDQNTTIVLQVANYSHARGGPEHAITLWDKNKLERKLHFMSLWYSIALGILFSIGLIHLIFYLADRKHREQGPVHLWFALLCFILVVRISGVIPFFHIYTPESPYWSDLTLPYMSLFAAPAIYLLFFRSAFPKQFPTRITKFLIWLSIGFTVFVFLTPESIYTHTKNFSIWLNVFVVVYSLVFTARALAKGEAGAGAILIANFLFFLTVVHDAIIYMKNGNGFDMTAFGFMLLGLGYSYALLLRLQKTFHEARRTSSALEKLNLKLEEQVRERTRAFKSAAANAENLAHDKAQFIAAASHDLRQPLHALAMFNLALKRSSDDPNISGLLEKQEKSINNLGNLLQDTLDTAKIDSVNRMPEFFSVEVKKLIEELTSGFDIQAENRGLIIYKNISAGHIITDSAMLKRVLSNLIDNALKEAMSRIEICADIKGINWIFSVKDDGRGIEPNDVHRIFESYISLRDKDDGAQGGYGLGLYVVNEFTKQLGGSIKIDSTSSKGSTFVVTLPQSLDNALTNNRYIDANEADMSNLSLNVLAIDDEPEILDAMEAMLMAWGCQIVTANGLSQALNHINSGYRPDILIVDYHLRRTNGLSVIAQLRNEIDAKIPAIIITGATEPDVLKKIKNAGFEVLAKPIDAHRLSALLDAL